MLLEQLLPHICTSNFTHIVPS
uniref:Uncharacterized protein n=1 Tax=Rhizophora mucronata TaxID=61149 RepID=A0A2P2NR14_RHIMU